MRNLMWAALATGFLWAGTGVASANDTVRLGGPAAQAAIQGGADTELVRWRHGYYGRAYYGGYYRPYYYGGYYRPYYYSAYYRPYYYTPTYYYPAYYYNQPCYSASYSYYPIAGASIPQPTTTLQATFYSQSSIQPPSGLPLPSNGNGTFRYDGGPPSVVPMPNPGPETNPANSPRGIIPIDGRLVSLPTQASGGTSQVGVRPAGATPRVTYPAYGE